MMGKLTIYGTATGCEWCTKAVELCRKKGIVFDFIDVSEREDLKAMIRHRHAGKIPYILSGERVIGGFDQLQAEVF